MLYEVKRKRKQKQRLTWEKLDLLCWAELGQLGLFYVCKTFCAGDFFILLPLCT